jgi:hypothetical protein
VLRIGLASAASVVLVVVALPKVAGAPWADIRTALQVPTPTQLALLAVAVGPRARGPQPGAHGSTPGLTVRRALTLNLTGSALSNVLPLGGGLGIGLNYLMVRRWGFTSRQFSLYTGAVNAWHVAIKALLPAAALVLLAANDVALRQSLLLAAGAGSGVAARHRRRGRRRRPHPSRAGGSSAWCWTGCSCSATAPSRRRSSTASRPCASAPPAWSGRPGAR